MITLTCGQNEYKQEIGTTKLDLMNPIYLILHKYSGDNLKIENVLSASLWERRTNYSAHQSGSVIFNKLGLIPRTTQRDTCRLRFIFVCALFK